MPSELAGPKQRQAWATLLRTCELAACSFSSAKAAVEGARLEGVSLIGYKSTGLRSLAVIAAFQGNIEALRALTAAGVDLASASEDVFPMGAAASCGRVERVRALIDHGCPVDGAGAPCGGSKGGELTPLMQSAAAGEIESARTLIAAGAKMELRDKQGRTALHMAAVRDEKDMAALLAEAGADLAARDREGRDPETSAREVGNNALAEMLAVHALELAERLQLAGAVRSARPAGSTARPAL